METITNISKAKKEVWEWKENASEKLNKLSKKERLSYLRKYETTFKDFFKKLKEK